MCCVLGQLKHFIEVVLIPASSDNNKDILELSTFNPMLCLERRVAGKGVRKTDDFLVRSRLHGFTRCG